MRTYIRKDAYGQRLKRYPFCLLKETGAVFDERRSTAGIEQKRQKDTSGKRGHVKPVHPCTGLTTRFANSKTWLLCGTTAILGGSDAADARIFTKESDYGFRDYAPAHARFITEDPIRDGRLIVYILVHY